MQSSRGKLGSHRRSEEKGCLGEQLGIVTVREYLKSSGHGLVS